MPKLEFAPMALEDLQHVQDYMINNWGEDVAKKILIKIIKDIRRLEDFPLLGIDLGKIIEVPTDYRYLFTEKNYVFYHLEFDKVRVVRVLNEQQDYMMALFGVS